MKVFFVFLLALQLCGGVWAQDEKPSAAAAQASSKLRR